jgi:hypothetical protein
MNSLQKQTNTDLQETPDHYVLKYETTLSEMNNWQDVELLLLKLQFLGMNFDPFDSNVTSECQQVMENLGLTEHLKNPYLATNILLRLLDKTEERINNLKQ